jgi:CubicO group peptidase (beta-lactamase class C family)
VPGEKQYRVVAVHRRRSDGSFERDPSQPSIAPTRFGGGGGLSSTAADYIRFLQMLLNRGTSNGARVLSADTVTLMGTNHIGVSACVL